MAIMYPKNITEYLPTESERFVYNELQKQLPDSFVVFYSVEWSRDNHGKMEKSEADFMVALAPESDNKVARVKELKDPVNTHKYSFNNVMVAVDERLKKMNIRLGYEKGFNSYVLGLVMDFYDVKRNPDYAYKHVIGNQNQYTYSQQFVEFIVEEIKKNPEHFVESLKKQ